MYNARKDWNTIVQFGKLKDNVKTEIVQLTDKSPTESRIIQFTSDMSSTSGFTDFLNDADNFEVVESFLGYRKDYTTEKYDEVAETFDYITNSDTQAKVIKWHDHAVTTSSRKGKFQEGKDFENWIKGQLTTDNSAVYQALKTYFSNEQNSWNLDEYSIYNQVYFCINGSTTATCTDEGSYFIADFVFVKEVTIGNTTVLDIKIADTKLSVGARFTDNQNDAMSLIPNPLYIRALKPENLLKGNPSSLFNIGNPIPNKDTFYKIYSSGTTTSYGGVTK